MKKKIGIFASILLLVAVVIWGSSSAQAMVQHRRVHHVHRRVHRHGQEYAHSGRASHRYYIVRKHRTKLQHAKIIAGPAKTGASVGGLIGGPPGAAVGAAAGAATGTAYDVKTRKKKVYK